MPATERAASRIARTGVHLHTSVSMLFLASGVDITTRMIGATPEQFRAHFAGKLLVTTTRLDHRC